MAEIVRSISISYIISEPAFESEAQFRAWIELLLLFWNIIDLGNILDYRGK